MAPSTSIVSTGPIKLPIPSTVLPLEVCTKLGSVEKNVVPNFNLHQFFVFQRDLFMTMVGLELEAWITQEQFQILWKFYVSFVVENLFTKNLAWKHLRLLDPFAAYVVMEDVEARIFLY